ncbi:MAG: transcription antitermination factor NusB [Bacteroidota bacterium]
MLSRRVLRIKAMQAVYTFSLAGNDNLGDADRRMMAYIEKIHDLFIYQLSVLAEIVDVSAGIIETGKQKYFPTEEEKNPNLRFINNRLVRAISDHPDYKRRRDALKINWSEDKDIIRNLFIEIRDTEEFEAYMNSAEDSFASDARFIINAFAGIIAESEELKLFYEEKNVNWVDDFDFANLIVNKTLIDLSKSNGKMVALPSLFSEDPEEEAEDRKFVHDLFMKTVIHSEKFDKMIEGKVQNWEIERIALMDLILIKMAICEFTQFPSIPVKVTINEYIEISKMYSTPKSKLFINGILDNLVPELTELGLMKKTGRGLRDS